MECFILKRVERSKGKVEGEGGHEDRGRWREGCAVPSEKSAREVTNGKIHPS